MNNRYLAHHGIRGMRWGVRRYQNSDGTLTSEGKKRYGHLERNDGKHEYYEKGSSSERKTYNKLLNTTGKNLDAVASKVADEIEQSKEFKDWQDVLSKRGHIDINGQRTLSYLDKDYSLDELLETMMSDTEIREAYEQKTKDILAKYKDAATDAALLDSGYKVTQEGKEYVNYLLDKYD